MKKLSLHKKSIQLSLIILLILGLGCNPSSPKNETKLNNSKTSFKLKILEGQPIAESTIYDLLHSFQLGYKSPYDVGATTNELNPNILKADSLEIPLSVIVNFLRIDSINKKDTGAALFYILDKTDSGKLYFTYAITLARFDRTNKKVEPIPNSDGTIKYLVPLFNSETSPSYKIITTDSFTKYKNSYYNSIVTRDFINNQNDSVKNVADHPTNTFYSDSVLYHFYTQNYIMPNINYYNLKILNGAIYKGDKKSYYKVQTSVLLLEYNNKIISSNMDINLAYPYRGKALDVGRLCPPECD